MNTLYQGQAPAHTGDQTQTNRHIHIQTVPFLGTHPGPRLGWVLLTYCVSLDLRSEVDANLHPILQVEMRFREVKRLAQDNTASESGTGQLARGYTHIHCSTPCK